jgi:phosphate transport system substrate-binding protein
MQSWHAARWSKLVLLGAVALGFAGASGTNAAETGRLLETGSSLLYPLFNIWVPAYSKAQPDVQITTQSTGSGTGISESVSGLAQIGASDAYLSNALEKQHPDVLNIPLAISSQMVNYNLPGLNGEHLKLSGPVLAGIYQGKITKWDDPQIAKLNPGVKLPDNTIVPVHRTDGSGDTFIFSQYLTDTSPGWARSIAYGTTISWPSVQGELGAEGNQGMVNSVSQTPYSIAYIGISFKRATDTDKLGEAMLENRAGKFVLPDAQTVQAAANSMVAKTPKDERISLIFAPGSNAYPIINYEYAIIRSKQSDTAAAQDLKTFLDWALSGKGGNAPTFMQQVSFVPLPPSVQKLSQEQVAKISG